MNARARLRNCLQTRWPTEPALAVRRRNPCLATELVRRASLALRDADHLGSMARIELVLVLRLLRQQPLDKPEQPGQSSLQFDVAGDLAADIAQDATP